MNDRIGCPYHCHEKAYSAPKTSKIEKTKSKTIK
jgi:hypothetical protein